MSNYTSIFVFLQEHWLPQHEAHVIIESDFKDYKFITTLADLFSPIEERLLETGPIWHGSALGWDKIIDSYIYPLQIVNEKFCGVKYVKKEQNISILAFIAYLPTSGDDDFFMDILSEVPI